jgi:hypothetical protein
VSWPARNASLSCVSMNQHVWGEPFVLKFQYGGIATIANDFVMNWERNKIFSDVSEKVSDVSMII